MANEERVIEIMREIEDWDIQSLIALKNVVTQQIAESEPLTPTAKEGTQT